MAVGLKDATLVLTAEEVGSLLTRRGDFDAVEAKVWAWRDRLDAAEVPQIGRRIVFAGEILRFYGMPVIAGAADA